MPPTPASPLGFLGALKHFAGGDRFPPIGRYRYFCTLYDLDTVLPEIRKKIRVRVQEAMEGRIPDRAEPIGAYEKA